jgi:CcmD family protein
LAARRTLTLVIVVFALGLFACKEAAAASGGRAVQPQTAQAQPAPEGFEPVTGVPTQEQLPAAPLVMIAYAFVWVMLLLYLWALWRRLGAVEKELADVTRRLGEGRRS